MNVIFIIFIIFPVVDLSDVARFRILYSNRKKMGKSNPYFLYKRKADNKSTRYN